MQMIYAIQFWLNEIRHVVASYHILNVQHFAPATMAPMINTNVNRNPNPNPNPNLNPYPTLNQTPNHYPHSDSLLSEISSQKQFSSEQMSDHPHFAMEWHWVCTGSICVKYDNPGQESGNPN